MAVSRLRRRQKCSEKSFQMTMTTLQMDLELRRRLRRARVRTYKIALVIGLLWAVPVYLVKDSAPWLIAVPICIGALINVVLDWRESKAVVPCATNQFVVVQVSQSFYRVPRPAAQVASISIDWSAERERFEAQAREANRSNRRLVVCHA